MQITAALDNAQDMLYILLMTDDFKPVPREKPAPIDDEFGAVDEDVDLSALIRTSIPMLLGKAVRGAVTSDDIKEIVPVLNAALKMSEAQNGNKGVEYKVTVEFVGIDDRV